MKTTVLSLSSAILFTAILNSPSFASQAKLSVGKVKSMSVAAFRKEYSVPKSMPVYATGCRLYAKGLRGTCDVQSPHENSEESISKCSNTGCTIQEWYLFNPK